VGIGALGIFESCSADGRRTAITRCSGSAERGATRELRNRRGNGDCRSAVAGGDAFIREIVEAQEDYGVWFVFAAPVGFFIYVVASIAETNRAPFDLPEAESEWLRVT